MNQLSKEDRAVILAQYLNAECTLIEKHDDPYRMLGDVGMACKVSGIVISLQESGSASFQLSLFDLSDITDEDAVEVAKILGFHSSQKEMGKWYVKDGLTHKTDVQPHIIIQVIDFLRSRSYALPYKSVNLFDAGIAIRRVRV